MIHRIDTLTAPALAPFASLTEAQLRSRLDPSRALIIVESPKVITSALRAGLEPVSLLCEEKHIAGDAAEIIAAHPEMEVYTGSRELLASLTGYTLTRGLLCAMRRPAQPSVAEICGDARRVVVLEEVSDSTNIGSIFRSAAALGFDAVLLTRNCCDPLGRRAARVSMGSVFLVPWTWIDNPAEELKSLGFTTAALALRTDSINIDDPELEDAPRLALILGSEGWGLPAATIEAADHTVCIPMHHTVDSLNVAATAAIALWQLRPRNAL
ncbi:MAG: RNA methyltransferase [Bacteroidales bacterium]|nr:RNA methyltransferase [Bacteroidales bacterium]